MRPVIKNYLDTFFFFVIFLLISLTLTPLLAPNVFLTPSGKLTLYVLISTPPHCVVDYNTEHAILSRKKPILLHQVWLLL